MNIQTGKKTNSARKGMRRLFLSMMFTLGFFLIGHTSCFATTVTLQWGANTDSDLAGYKVYYQANSSSQPFGGTGATQGSAPIDVGNTTTATISGLDSSHEYYFAVTAYTTSGVESSYSNVISVPELLSPITSITYPANNATVSGTVSVAASASDNVGVTKIEFYVNNVLQGTETTSPYVFSWNTTGLTSGSYTLMTKAYDAAGNVGQSDSVSVTVASNAPAVSIDSPVSGATVGGTVAIMASASDNAGVTKVAFYVNGSLKTTDKKAPYTYNWSTKSLKNGNYTIMVKAYDASGHVTSTSIPVTVFNDKTAPTASITSPANGAKVGGTVTINAAASDNVDVAKCELYVNGKLKVSEAGSSCSFDWNTKEVSNGSYRVKAKAYDAAGNVKSTSISVKVFNDKTAPTVSIASPSKNAKVSGTVAVKANAKDSVAVARVEFYVNGSLKTTETVSPYSYDWNTRDSANGSNTIMVKAYDLEGNVKSTSIPVTVNNL
jgi:chitinase